MNAAGTSSFATNPFREISLNELADHSLGPCPRKPIFCSTPSAASSSKRRHPKLFPINDQSSASQSISVSCIGGLNTFEEDSPEKPAPPPLCASITGLDSKEKLQPSLDELQEEPDLHHHEEPSVKLFMEPRRRRCNDEAVSNSKDSGTKNDGQLPSVNLLSTDKLSDAEKVYAECGQQQPLPWEECILPHRMKKCVKIGEGTFGEVFSTTNASGDTVALKIIPVEGSEKVNGENQKTLGEILHEIIISKELSSLKEKHQNQTHGFIGLNDLHCVRGCYPPDFLNAWDTFDQRKGSENDRPDFFKKDQLFIILEFEFGGVDLENSNGTFTSLRVAKSILHQVTAALAVAEQELRFEHRDLHWGNVLVKTTKQKTGSFLLSGTAHSVETKGVLVRIIDYSLSRLEIDDLTVSCDISNDEDLFLGQGDYQFEVYRLMRKENGNNWSDYHPHTNVLWLHYLCSKLLSMKYRGTGGRSAKDMQAELTRFYDNVLQYSSATEALQNCPMFQ
uniref:Serine/threonine-protein kinase haspin n=1 Tax=Amphiprion percula TaxID=161767 RepID=A0A3P8TN75_AMPPE